MLSLSSGNLVVGNMETIATNVLHQMKLLEYSENYYFFKKYFSMNAAKRDSKFSIPRLRISAVSFFNFFGSEFFASPEMYKSSKHMTFCRY